MTPFGTPEHIKAHHALSDAKKRAQGAWLTARATSEDGASAEVECAAWENCAAAALDVAKARKALWAIVEDAYRAEQLRLHGPETPQGDASEVPGVEYRCPFCGAPAESNGEAIGSPHLVWQCSAPSCDWSQGPSDGGTR